MARIDTLANFLTDVSTAIKSKTGKTDAITPANFDTEIESIESGGGSSEPIVEPDYITDGLISWWEGEDGFDENGQWKSRVGTDYIEPSYFLYGTMNSNPPICSGGAVYNDGIHGMTTQQDYCIQDYTIQVVGYMEDIVNSSTQAMNMIVGMNMSASPMIGTTTNRTFMFGNAGTLSQGQTYANATKRIFNASLNLSTAPPRGSGSTLDHLGSVNGSDWFTVKTTNSATHTSKGTNMVVLGYYEATYRSCGARVYSIRVYNRKLTEEELKHNYEVDKARFNLDEYTE